MSAAIIRRAARHASRRSEYPDLTRGSRDGLVWLEVTGVVQSVHARSRIDKSGYISRAALSRCQDS